MARLYNIIFAYYEILLENMGFSEITKRTVISKIGKIKKWQKVLVAGTL